MMRTSVSPSRRQVCQGIERSNTTSSGLAGLMPWRVAFSRIICVQHARYWQMSLRTDAHLDAAGNPDVFVSRKAIADGVWQHLLDWWLSAKNAHTPLVLKLTCQMHKKGTNNWRAIEVQEEESAAACTAMAASDGSNGEPAARSSSLVYSSPGTSPQLPSAYNHLSATPLNSPVRIPNSRQLKRGLAGGGFDGCRNNAEWERELWGPSAKVRPRVQDYELGQEFLVCR